MATFMGLRYIPREDLILQTELRIANDNNVHVFLCPCRECHGGGRRRGISTIRNHLKENGRDSHLMRSMLGRDPPGGYPEHGIFVDNEGQHWEAGPEEEFRAQFPQNDMDDFGDIFHDAHGVFLDNEHDVQQQVYDAFDMGDTVHAQAAAAATIHDIEDDHDNNMEIPNNIEELYEQAATPVWQNSTTSVISATIVLLNMAVIHGISNAYMDELLCYLHQSLLPRGNLLPGTHYEAKRVIRKLGLTYKIIHTCPSGCVLYCKDNENLTKCPKPDYRKSRFVAGSNIVPTRVICHFPIILRLHRMFRSPVISSMLKWHFRNKSSNEIMKSVVDSPAWKHVDLYPHFAEKENRLRFGLSLDGVNPHKLNSTSHSTWLVLLLIYNLPPFLVTKRFFITLSILISGKESPTSKNIDVFLQPLVEELQELWIGIDAQDFSKPHGQRWFKMCGLLLWTISDFPAYGLISGLCTKGYRACPVCGPNTDSRGTKCGTLKENNEARGSKIIYGGARRWLRSLVHPYRRNERFNGNHEMRRAPRRMSSREILQQALRRKTYLDNSGKPGDEADPVHFGRVKRQSILFNLPYWDVIFLAPFLYFISNSIELTIWFICT
jgi:hypothetical protein